MASDSDPQYPDVTASILTPAQRKYLLGEGDVKEGSSSERALRRRIRNRMMAGLSDLQILGDKWGGRDRTMVIEGLGEVSPTFLLNRTTDTIDFLFSLLLEPEALAQLPGRVTSIEPVFESTVESAVRRAVSRRGESLENVSVEITIDRGPAFSEYEDVDLVDIPRHILRQMQTVNEISDEEFARAVLAKKEAREEDSPSDIG
jgi:hypothetical protein